LKHLSNHAGLSRSLLSSLRHFVFRMRPAAFRAVGSHARPLAVMWGPKDNITPIEDAPELLRLLPNAKLTTVADTGHWVRGWLGPFHRSRGWVSCSLANCVHS